jgi:hypothetical protein
LSWAFEHTQRCRVPICRSSSGAFRDTPRDTRLPSSVAWPGSALTFWCFPRRGHSPGAPTTGAILSLRRPTGRWHTSASWWRSGIWRANYRDLSRRPNSPVAPLGLRHRARVIAMPLNPLCSCARLVPYLRELGHAPGPVAIFAQTAVPRGLALPAAVTRPQDEEPSLRGATKGCVTGRAPPRTPQRLLVGSALESSDRDVRGSWPTPGCPAAAHGLTPSVKAQAAQCARFSLGRQPIADHHDHPLTGGRG